MDEIKALLDFIMMKKSKKELIENMLEHNAQFHKRMKWIANNPKQEKLKAILDVLEVYDKAYLREFVESDPGKKTIAEFNAEKDLFAALHKLYSIIATYAVQLGYLDMSAFEEWKKNQEK